MPKTKISEFSATPGNNTDIDGINLAEGCAPSGINDAIRELMAQLKDFQAGTAGDSFNGPVGTSTAAAGAFTTLSSTGNTTLGDAVGDTITINGTATFVNANPTISSGTANGVAYLNGSKVLTTGSALTFDGTAFSTTGTINAGTAANAYRVANWTLAGYSGNTLQFGNATTAGEWTDMSWSLSGSEQMRLTSTGLGIGTSNPQRKLSIANGGPHVEIDPAGISGTDPIYFNYNRSTSTYLTPQYWALAHNWRVSGGTSAMTLDSSGNLGLGVTPSAWDFGGNLVLPGAGTYIAAKNINITFGANLAYTGGAEKYVASNPASKYYQGSGTHQWYTAPSGTAGNAISFTQAMTLDASGNLGVGTTSPAGRMDIQGDQETPLRVTRTTTTTGAVFLRFNNGGGNYFIGPDSSTGNRGFATGGAAYGLVISTESANPITLGTNNIERARITSGGDLLVGTTSLIGGLNKQIEIAGANSAGLSLIIGGSQKGFWYAYSAAMRCESSSGNNIEMVSGGTGGVVLTNGATSWGSLSDERKKDIIEPITNAATKVASLRSVIGKYKTDNENTRRAFLIAQDVQAVLPEAVVETDAGDLILQYTETIPLLVAAIQEQQALITDLRARVAQLEGTP